MFKKSSLEIDLKVNMDRYMETLSNHRIKDVNGMKVFSALILATAIALCGCAYQDENKTYNSSENNPVINSNCPVYKDKNELYYIQQNDPGGSYDIMCENEDGKQKLLISGEEFVKDLFVKDGDLYYSAFDQENKAHIFMYGLKNENETELFSVPSDHLSQSFIYSVGDDIYYYGKGTLYMYKDNESSVVISDADSCIVSDTGIYYSKGNDIYLMVNGRSECIISEQSIYSGGAGDEIIKSSGGQTVIGNIEISGDGLLFALCDANFRNQSSELLRWSKKDNKIERVCKNFIAYNTFLVSKGSIYACGKDIGSGTKGIFKIGKTGEAELVSNEMPVNGLYVSDNQIYYYSLSKETGSILLRRAFVNKEQ